MQPFSLRPEQDQAADFLYENNRAMVLAAVGAGKTAITLTAMQAMLDDGHVRRWLVIAPKRVCEEVWPVEAAKWARTAPVLAVGPPARRAAAFAGDARVVVTNYDIFDRPADLSGFDGVVFDELTRLKNPSGARFKKLEKLIKHIDVRWGLTGSFTSNGLEDVFGQCKIIDTGLLGRAKGAFMQQYFVCVNRDFGQWEPVRGSLARVMQRIRSATTVLDAQAYRRSLPPCHVHEVTVPLSDRKPYDSMKRSYVARFDNARVVAQNAAVVTAKLQQLSGGFVYNRDAGAAPIWFSHHKLDRLGEILSENQRASTLIVYNYQEELAELKRRYPHAQTLDDDNAVERWNQGQIELLLVHPKSAGHGLNLQYGGHCLVFMSLPWSLELYEQVVGRLHRSGQTTAVQVYVLLAKDTIDQHIWAALHDKQALADIALKELSNG